MIKRIHIAVVVTVLIITSCATSMTPMQVNNTLPTLTMSKYISQAQADENVKNGTCKYLAKNRTYAAPMGLSTKEDLRYGAKGIDEWVKLDGGNAYVLKNYRWVTVDNYGSTQLTIDFDTMICE
ncbi:hypothetical protein QEG73_15015 [Chitinophagaceae bacterium 26-R-25]|nr:hypothetical protein [Chitinophagaceae bacterium 26-R-25]